MNWTWFFGVWVREKSVNEILSNYAPTIVLIDFCHESNNIKAILTNQSEIRQFFYKK
jgi:hypothetical protein